MDNPKYMVINPMHMKVLMQGYMERTGKYVENKSDIKHYYMKSIFKKGYVYK